jgi:predicted dehydrogenase
MVRIGIVGVGFMGMIHYLASRQLKGAAVTAVCSRDARKLAGDWRGIRGNFGPRGDVMDLSHLKKYDRLDALLADPDIDLVDVCNPTHLHAPTAIAALRAGKHVLVEKAIALTPAEADAMLDAARQAAKLLMVAHVLPFVPEFAYAAGAVRGNEYGKLLAANFTRVISRPDWSAEIGDAAKTGGPAVDLHIHDTHFIGYVCGVPDAVFSTGVQQNGVVQHLTTLYVYGPGGPCVSCTSGALSQKGREFVHGYEIFLERATLVYESGTKPLTLLTADGRAERVALPAAGELAGFTTEIQAAADGVASGQEPELLSGRLARDALVMCLQECASVATGRAVAIKES